MKIFISYCNNGGLTLASSTAAVLEQNGHQAWYFARDKNPGKLRITDISEHIRHWCHKILYLCTDQSLSSDGQLYEIGQWDNSGKQLIVIRIDSAVVPIEIDPYIYETMDSIKFSKEFNEFVINRLGKIVRNWEERPEINVKNTAGSILP